MHSKNLASLGAIQRFFIVMKNSLSRSTKVHSFVVCSAIIWIIIVIIITIMIAITIIMAITKLTTITESTEITELTAIIAEQTTKECTLVLRDSELFMTMKRCRMAPSAARFLLCIKLKLI